jgi:hypothetical protein
MPKAPKPFLRLHVRASRLEFVLALIFVSFFYVVLVRATQWAIDAVELAISHDASGRAIIFGYCGNPCVIQENKGGDAVKFVQAASKLKEGQRVIVDGECYSACVLFADFARPKVCITDRAEFFLHMGSSTLVKPDGTRLAWYPPHSDDIEEYVSEHGGYPQTGIKEKMLPIQHPDTLKFWPKCDLAELG